jgi:putative membrane protein
VSFTQHMAWHMLLVAAIAPAVAMVVRGTRLDPARLAPSMFSPIAASVIEFAVVWSWHTPFLHALARHDGAWFAAEQFSFVTASLFLWLSILGGEPRERSARAASGVIALVLTFAHMTMLGVLITLASRPLYGHHGVADQQAGGALMLIAGTVAFPAAALYLSRTVLMARSLERSRP